LISGLVEIAIGELSAPPAPDPADLASCNERLRQREYRAVGVLRTI